MGMPKNGFSKIIFGPSTKPLFSACFRRFFQSVEYHFAVDNEHTDLLLKNGSIFCAFIIDKLGPA